MKLRLRLALLVAITLLAVGCTPNMLININSIADKSLSQGENKYIIVSDMSDVNVDDLYFKEFSHFFDRVLQQQGYKKVADRSSADIVIKFKYAVSDGRNGVRSYRFPVYENIGGYSYPLTIVSTDSAGKVTTTVKTVYMPSRTVYVGSETEVRSYTLYNRTVSLRAVVAAKNDGSAKPEKIVWQTQIYNVSESNDLRQAMPYFAYAAAGYLGKNSGQQQSVELKLKDPGVQALIKSQQ